MSKNEKKLKHLLLVDDSARDRELIVTALKEINIDNIAEACDGEEAIDYLLKRGQFKDRQNGHPSVVVMDIKMPKIDGMEVLKLIKTNEELNTIPVVVLTSSNQQRDIAACYRLGVNAYVVKPVEFTEFFDSIKVLGTFWAVTNKIPGE
jgi:CheY-like chemotaxis protein